jgi:hypothetical protein
MDRSVGDSGPQDPHVQEIPVRESTPFHDPRIPRGCDQQVRYPQAAEAATELGAADEDNDGFAEFFVPLAAAIIGCLTLIIWAVIHA